MSLEGQSFHQPKPAKVEVFAPEFAITISRESTSEKESIIKLSYGHVTFAVEANLVSYAEPSNIKMIGNESNKADDELDTLREAALQAAQKYVEDRKIADYIENFY